MTLIMWAIYPNEGVEIYTDTLVSTEGGEAVGETQKYIVTATKVAIAGTGGADTIEAWQAANTGSLASLDELVADAELQLPPLHDSCYPTSAISSTVFHFGWSNVHRQFVGAVQSSKNQFAPTFRLRPGLGIRPDTRSPFAPDGDAGFLALARQIQLEQNLRSNSDPDRVPIGGRLMMIDITTGGVLERSLGPI